MTFLATGLTVLAVLWGVMIVAAPLALTRESAAAAALVYTGASRICHQRPERSFQVQSVQMPVCARCTGLYLSSVGGALLAWRARRRREDWRRAVLVAAALPTALTWLLEFLGIIAFSNAARAAAALPLGGYAGWLFVRMLRYDSRLDAEQNLHG